MDGTSGHNREKYMALWNEWAKIYGDENLYHLTNFHGIVGISILLGFISVLFFFLILISLEKTLVKNKIFLLKKILLIALLVSAFIITFMNLWTLM
jgi:glucan phosphoethanolaminetransferase (alkaline phosphatase superfamily)